MSNQLNLKEEIREGKKQFKSLSFYNKLIYIKDYYSLHILTVIIIAVVIFAAYRTYQAKNFNTVLYAVLINNDKSIWDDDTDSYESKLSDPFEEYLGIDGDADRFIIDNNYILNPDKDLEMSAYSAESLIAMIFASQVDIHIGDKLSFEYFSADDELFFYDLRELFDEDFLERHKDKIIYQLMTNGDSIPTGFDISSSQIVKDAGLTTSPTIISIFSNTTQPETAVKYIRFILDIY